MPWVGGATSIITYLVKGTNSTIDLIFVLKELMSNSKFCQIYSNDYGLDYEFFQTEFLVKITPLVKMLWLLFNKISLIKVCKYL